MATSVVPALIDALVAAAAAALPMVVVVDGFALSDDPGDTLLVGVEDPDDAGRAYSATAQQRWANANYTARDQQGEVVCAAIAWDGASSQKAARDRAYGITATVENLLRANPSLGVPQLLWTGYGTQEQLIQDQGDNGALALVVFRVEFRART